MILQKVSNFTSMTDDSNKNFGRSWISCLPEGVGHINDISNEAVWTLSSAKGIYN
jgi:hypothetical protein